MIKLSKKQAYQYGMDAEAYASRFLESAGMKIICMRFNTPFGELDIVAKDDEYLVFVEVKARNDVRQQDIVPRSKIIKICKAADFYMVKHNLNQDIAIRFDYVALEGDKVINHIKNAWDYCGGGW